MASSLHYVTPLQLSDTFNEWFLRSNSLIDVVNKINVYNVENGWGLARYRGIDGTTVLRINIGQQENEYDGSAITGDYNYGLRFIDDPGSTGVNNPDVSAQRKILAIDIENLPSGTGGVSGALVAEGDYYMFADNSSGTGSVVKIKAGDMLPYGISGDHRFYGNIYFDGTSTTINSTELNIDDLHVNLATSNTGDTDGAYADNAALDGAGIIIKGASGDKQWIYDFLDAGSTQFNSFKSNIDIQLSSNSKLTSEDKLLELFSMVDDDFDVSLTQLNNADKLWKIRKSNISDGQSRLIFFHENTVSGVTKDAISLSKMGTVVIGELDGKIISGGVTHDSSFSYLPAAYSIPTSGNSGDSYLHYKWTNRKLITQASHGFTAGDLIRYYPFGNTYDRAWNGSKESAEVIAIVEDGNYGGSADQFVGVFGGLVDLSQWTPSGWASADGTTMSAGQVYFLSDAGSSGGWTADEPTVSGAIKKPVLLAIGEKEALFVNYLGHEVSTSDVEASLTGSYVFSEDSSGYLVSTSMVPNQGFKNKVINGDFTFWQRAEDGGVSGGTYGANNWDGTTGARFVNTSGAFVYTCDMWGLDTRVDSTAAEVQKHGHTFADGPNTNGMITETRGAYARILNNTTSAGKTSYFCNRIENVATLAPIVSVGGTQASGKATVSYYVKGVTSGAVLPESDVNLYQVYDGNSGDGLDFAGGGTSCLAVNTVSGATSASGHFTASTAGWTKYTHTFILNSVAGMTGAAGSYDADNNWLELRFAIPSDYGGSGGIDLARVQLEGGDEATDWEDRPHSLEETFVNRYYQRHTVGMDLYSSANGMTFGVAQKWHTTPYPNYDVLSDNVSLTSKVAFANDIEAVNCETAGITNINSAMANRGFKVKRLATANAPVEMLTTYHFDFGIYD